MDELRQLDGDERLCLEALKRLADEQGSLYLQEAEVVAARTGLDEWERVKPALARVAELGGCTIHDTDAMPTRYLYWHPIAVALLGLDACAPLIPDGPRIRLSHLATRV